EEDLCCSVERPLLPLPDLALGALHAVEPVRRGAPEAAELREQRLVDAGLTVSGIPTCRQLPVGTRDRATRFRIDLVDAGGDEEGGDPDDDEDRREDGECGREPDPPATGL